MTTGQPWRIGVWLPVVAGLALVFFFVVPWLPSLAATERPVIEGERVTAQTASFEPATGWTLDLDAATSARPTVTLNGVTVQLRDGVWFGSTADLITRLGEQLVDGGASVGPLPQAPDDDGLLSLDVEATEQRIIPRAEYVIEFTSGDAEGRLLVVREDASVALLRTTGPADGLAAQESAIAGMEDSVDTGAVSVDNVPTEPR